MLFVIDEAAIGLLNIAIVNFCRNRCKIVHLTSKQLSIFVKTDFDNLPKRAVNSLLETAGELYTSIDPECTV